MVTFPLRNDLFIEYNIHFNRSDIQQSVLSVTFYTWTNVILKGYIQISWFDKSGGRCIMNICRNSKSIHKCPLFLYMQQVSWLMSIVIILKVFHMSYLWWLYTNISPYSGLPLCFFANSGSCCDMIHLYVFLH